MNNWQFVTSSQGLFLSSERELSSQDMVWELRVMRLSFKANIVISKGNKILSYIKFDLSTEKSNEIISVNLVNSTFLWR